LAQSSLTDRFAVIAAGAALALESVPDITPNILGAASVAVQLTYNKAFQVVYFVSIAFGTCAIIAALVIDPSKMAGKMTTDIICKLQGVGSGKTVEWCLYEGQKRLDKYNSVTVLQSLTVIWMLF
jgi:hypothetical protein